MVVTLRELGPGEFDVLDTVFAGLLPGSRFDRFHSPIPRMLPSVREGLAAVDGCRHVAVAAFADGEPIGIARLIATEGGPSELAVEVVDRWQGLGVGARLVRAVADRGRALGHTIVRADVLAGNLVVRRLLMSVLPDATVVADGPEITYRAHLAVLPGAA